MKRVLKNQHGFNIVELMVTVAIIGSLASMSIASYDQSMMKVRDGIRLGYIRNIEKALFSFYTDHGRYPNLANDGISNSGNYVGVGSDFDTVMDNYFKGEGHKDPIHDGTVYFISYDPAHCYNCDCSSSGPSIAINKFEFSTKGAVKEICTGGDMNQHNAQFSKEIRIPY